MPFAGAIATCSILLLLMRVPFAEGQSSEATSESFMMEQILSENGCGSFAGLVAATAPAGEAFRERVAGDDGGPGLTIFCPYDEAVAAFGPGRFSNLSADDQVTLLLYHGVAERFDSEVALAAIVDRKVATLGYGSGDYDIRIYDGAVILSSSGNAAFITRMFVHSDRLVVYLIDSVLIPGEKTACCNSWAAPLVDILCIACILVGMLVLYMLLTVLVRLAPRLRRSCQDCATTYVSAARVAPQG